MRIKLFLEYTLLRYYQQNKIIDILFNYTDRYPKTNIFFFSEWYFDNKSFMDNTLIKGNLTIYLC